MVHSEILRFFAKYIESEVGIVYAEHNFYQLQSRLEEIAKLVGCANISVLFEQAQSGISGAFKHLLLDLATNNETSFFRDPRIFKAIENTILPSFIEQFGLHEKMTIWSAASSTGQEALSMSILIDEFNAKQKSKLQFSITATDISDRVLERARSATYSQLEIQRGLPAPYLIKYFKKDEQDKWVAARSLVQNIEYKKINLKENFNFAKPFHFILCRNVLIYQSVESKKQVLNRLTRYLVDGGFLVLGAGESLLGLSSDYEQVHADTVVVYRKKAKLMNVA
jgi:chemotaxis protein methyltransferase CheR